MKDAIPSCIALAVAIGIVCFSFWCIRQLENKCTSKGGVMLAGAGSYVCIEAKQIK
jgi:hypothetical protein